MDFPSLVFYACAALVLAFGGAVAFSRNIVYSAFGLLGCFAGVAGLYVLLSADFIGILQLFVYVGGITVLIVFAVMLTNHLGDVKITSQSMNSIAGLVTAGLTLFLLFRMIEDTPWKITAVPSTAVTTEAIGDLLLTKYLLPFELISLILLVALIGAIVIARRDDKSAETGS